MFESYVIILLSMDIIRLSVDHIRFMSFTFIHGFPKFIKIMIFFWQEYSWKVSLSMKQVVSNRVVQVYEISGKVVRIYENITPTFLHFIEMKEGAQHQTD